MPKKIIFPYTSFSFRYSNLFQRTVFICLLFFRCPPHKLLTASASMNTGTLWCVDNLSGFLSHAMCKCVTEIMKIHMWKSRMQNRGLLALVCQLTLLYVFMPRVFIFFCVLNNTNGCQWNTQSQYPLVITVTSFGPTVCGPTYLCVCANSLVITVYTQFVTSEILSVDECTRARSRTWREFFTQQTFQSDQ